MKVPVCIVLCSTALICLVASAAGLDNGQARTPPMGWNSWNHYMCKTSEITETMFMAQAKAMVDSGLAKVGYQYINMDDCWMVGRNASGVLQPDPDRFPHGIKYLSDYIHSLGLKFGIYEDTGPKTCMGWPGSEGYYKLDAQTYASWNVDLFKFDGCFTDVSDMKTIYTENGQYLNATGRPMVYLCSWPTYTFVNNVSIDFDYVASICNVWREYYDIRDSWDSWTDILDYQVAAGLHKFAGPGHWNDPDMLEVGNGNQTDAEYTAHFSLWAMLAAPLILGNDLTNMTAATLAILSNAEVIAVDQDALGVQGQRVHKAGPLEVWARPLHGGSRAVVLFNRSEQPAQITAEWTDIGLPASAKALVRDLWRKGDVGTFDTSFGAVVQPHSVVMVKITPTDATA